MSHPLVEKIAQVKQRARRMLLLRAMGYVLAVGFFAALLLTSLDCFLRLEDTGTRTLFTLGWILVIGLAVRFWLMPLLRSNLDNRRMAQMLERRFPSLQDRLSSSVAFLEPTDGETPYGSKSLMRNLIAETHSELETLNIEDALDTRPMWRAFGWLGGVIVACIALLVANPSLGPLAARRLLVPWQTAPWPRIHHLRFVDVPERIARGADLRFVVEDAAGRFPQSVDLQVIAESKRRVMETLPMVKSGEQMVLDRKNITRSLRYRAVGGDDTAMDWHTIQVVDPPEIVSGSTELTPPAYTGWVPQRLTQATGELRVLAGTQVVLSGEADRVLSEVQLSYEVEDKLFSFRSAIQDGARTYRVPSRAETWLLEKPGEYALTLMGVDQTKTVGAELWNVRVIPDQPPTISVLSATNEDWITSSTVISLELSVEDDLRVKRVDLRFMRSDQSELGESVVALFLGPGSAEPAEMPRPLQLVADRIAVTHDWSLNEMNLPSGAVLSYFLSAEDYKGQQVQSPPQRFTVVSEQELVDRVARRHSVILARLKQRLEQQRQANQQVEAVQAKLSASDKLEKSTMDRLQSALLSQRQVNSALAGEDAPIIAELEGLRRVLERSRIAESTTGKNVAETLSVLKQLASSDLEPAFDFTSNAQRLLQAGLDEGQSKPSTEASSMLNRAADHQASAVRTLEGLLDDMSSWDNYRRVAQDLNELLRQQNEVQRQTQTVARQTLSRLTDELDGEQRAAMRLAASRQMDLARRMDRTIENLSKAQHKLQDDDPASEQMLQDAIQTARDLAIAGRMRQAGKMISSSRFGLAEKEQQSASSAIEEMLDQLSRRSYSPEESEQRLDVASRELQRLQNRQKQLSAEFGNAKKQRDPQKRGRELQRLSKRQRELMQQMHKLERNLQRLRAQQASGQLGKAQSSAEAAAAAADQNSALDAEQQSKLAEEQMEQAKEQLQQQLERVQSQLVAEQIARLPQRIEAVLKRQEALNGEVVRLDELRNSRGEWTAGMQASVKIAAETELALAADAIDLATSVDQLPAFSFTLREIAISMGEVAALLERDATDQLTQTLNSQIVDELQLMLDTMKKDPKSNSDAGEQGGSGSPGGGGNNNGEEFEPSLAQLKLLRWLQLRINEDTDRLNLTSAGDSEAQKVIDAKVRRISDRQGRLAELVSKLYRPANPKPPAARENEQSDLDALDQQLDSLLK